MDVDQSARFWRLVTPWSPNSLMADWSRLRQKGRGSFILRFGLFRIALLLAIPTAVLMIRSDVANSLMRWILLMAMYIAIGLIWSMVTWRTCESRWALIHPDELTSR
jgi:cell division protein FtsW (lipid II flippase)